MENIYLISRSLIICLCSQVAYWMDAELDSPRSREDTTYQRLFQPQPSFLRHRYWSVLLRRHVIHTVGPVYNSKEEKAEKAEQLASAYRTSLALALENSIRHVVSYPLFLPLFSPYTPSGIPIDLYRCLLVSYPWCDTDRAEWDQSLPRVWAWERSK